MATAVTNIATDELAVRQFLQSLFQKQAVEVMHTDAEPVAAGSPVSSGVATGPALKLHPRVDAAHPLVGPIFALQSKS
jgi:hypothetical protein